jgi:predicted nucleic acid-binding protein
MIEVLVDSSAWLEFFKPSGKPLFKEIIAGLIKEQIIVISGIIKAEILRGSRSHQEYQMLDNTLGGVRYLNVSEVFWSRLSLFNYDLSRKGVNVPLPDAYVALLAIENDVELLHYDRHLDLIAGKTKLKVFKLPG